MAFHFLDEDMMKTISISMITLKLKWTEVIWSSHKKMYVLKLERIQRIVTKMVPELKDLIYEERLKEMQLSTLEERRKKGDLITIHKLMNKLEERYKRSNIEKKRRDWKFKGTQEKIDRRDLLK